MTRPSVLIGCPIHAMKEYSFEEWISTVQKQKAGVLVVDNSPTSDLYDRYHARVPMFHWAIDGLNANQRVAWSMDVIRQYALLHGFDYYCNLDSDVIPLERDWLDRMIEAAEVPDWSRSYQPLDLHKRPGGIDWLLQPVPGRVDPSAWLYSTFSFVLFSRRILYVPFVPQPREFCADGWHYARIAGAGAYNLLHLPEHYLETDHRAPPRLEDNYSWTPEL